MPIVVPLNQCLQQSHDTQISGVKGKISKVLKFRTGTTSGKPWSFQDIVLNDGTAEVTVTFNNRPELPKEWAGHWCYLLAHQGPKGASGLKIKDEEYPKDSGTMVRKLWFTASGEMVEVTDPNEIAAQAAIKAPSPAVAPLPTTPSVPVAPPPAPALAQAPLPSPSAPASLNHTGEAGVHPVTLARQKIAQAGNLYLLCLDAAHKVDDLHQARYGVQLTADQFQALTATLFIHSDRGGLAESMPVSSKHLTSEYQRIIEKMEAKIAAKSPAKTAEAPKEDDLPM